MRFRIGLALCLSLILISGTVWLRSNPQNKPAPILVGVDNPVTDGQADSVTDLDAYLASDPAENLTTTDLIGRQLIGDYFNLVQSGQATEETLNNLIGTYTEGVENLQSNLAPTISLAELVTVADTKSNFVNYDIATTKIESERMTVLKQAYGDGQALETLNEEVQLLTQNIGEAYERAATKLRGVKVPVALAELHLRLINNFLSTAAGMKSVADTQNDSAMAMAGMISASKNLEEEKNIINSIIGILIKNGV